RPRTESSRSASGRRPRLLRLAARRAGTGFSSMTAEEIRRLGTEVDRAPWSASLAVSRQFDRCANAYVGPAAADVARHGIVDIGVGRARIAGDERGGGHDLARLAVAALNDLAVEPSLLDLGARRRRADRLDGRDGGRADAVDRGDAGA